MCLRRSNSSRGAPGVALSGPSEATVPLRQPDVPLRRSFSVVATVVTAVKRFQASLNPTVTFKKRNSDEDYPGYIPPDRTQSEGSALTRPPTLHHKTLTGNMRQLTRTPSGRLVPRKTYEQRGHMTGYLLKPLPELKATS